METALSAARQTSARNHGLLLLALPFVLLLPFSYLVMLNSGLGYDSLFYLIVGEDWTKGILPFTASVEIKPIGVFLISRFVISHLGTSPYWINLSVLFINCVLIITTVACCSKWLDRTEQFFLTVFLLGLSFLTEMSFLLSDQPTALFGILGFRLLMVERYKGMHAYLWNLLTGVMLGVSFLFKAVAAFYLVAALLTIVVIRYRLPREARPSKLSMAISGMALGAGFVIPYIPFALWAYKNSILGTMLLWTVWVPLFRYPGHRIFLVPFLLKLGPFLLTWLAAIWYWLSAAKGTKTTTDKQTWLVASLIFAVLSAVPLLKTQSSHYLITAMPFMAPFVAAVWVPAARHFSGRRLLVPALLVGLAACVCLAAVGRKFLARLHLPDFGPDRTVAAGILKWTKPGEHALFINGGVPRSSCYAYWITGLRPPSAWHYLAIEVYSYGMAGSHQGSLVRSLEDSSTTLVGVDWNDSPSYLGWPWPFSQTELREANEILHQRFEPVPPPEGAGLTGLWKLKNRAPSDTIEFAGGPYAGQSVHLK